MRTSGTVLATLSWIFLASACSGTTTTETDDGTSDEAALKPLFDALLKNATPFDFSDSYALLDFEPDTKGYFSTKLKTVKDPQLLQARWSQSDNAVDADSTPQPLYVRATSAAGDQLGVLLTSPATTSDGYAYTFSLSPPGSYKLLITTAANLKQAKQTPPGPPVSKGTFELLVPDSSAIASAALEFSAPKTPAAPTTSPSHKCVTASTPPSGCAIPDPQTCTETKGCRWAIYCTPWSQHEVQTGWGPTCNAITDENACAAEGSGNACRWTANCAGTPFQCEQLGEEDCRTSRAFCSWN
jgi:hypothetical protein